MGLYEESVSLALKVLEKRRRERGKEGRDRERGKEGEGKEGGRGKIVLSLFPSAMRLVLPVLLLKTRK